MASYAQGDRSRVGQVMNKQMLRDMTGGSGKLEDTIRAVEDHLARGGALSPGLVKGIQRRKDNEFMSKREQFWSNQAQVSEGFGKAIMEGLRPQGSANFRAIYGTQLAPGTVYTGGATQTTPGRSGRSVNGGYWSTKGSTSYVPQTMSEAVYRSLAQPQEEPAAPQAERKPYQSAQSLADAREAYDRSSEYLKQNGSAASPGFDANLTGGDLLNSIASAGQGQVDHYKRRFLPHLKNTSILQSEEIRNATGEAIAGLDPDLKLPEYENPFESGLYARLLKDVTRKKVA